MAGAGAGGPPTFGTDDLGPVPLAITLAPDGGHVVLGKSFVAPVAYSGVDVILGLAGTDGRSVLHCRRGTTQHWGCRSLQLGQWPEQDALVSSLVRNDPPMQALALCPAVTSQD